jgi:hypothetical protein
MRMYTVTTLILLGLFAANARGEDVKEAINLVEDSKSSTLDYKFLAVASLSYASAIYDTHTTFAALDRCGGRCFEANRLMSPFVANKPTAYAFTSGLTSVSTYATYRLKQRGKRWWWVPMTTTAVLHLVAGIHNQNIRVPQGTQFATGVEAKTQN